MVKEALIVRGKKEDKKSKSNSKESYKSPGKKFKAKCWNCGQTGHIRKDCREKKKNKSSLDSGSSLNDDGDVF